MSLSTQLHAIADALQTELIPTIQDGWHVARQLAEQASEQVRHLADDVEQVPEQFRGNAPLNFKSAFLAQLDWELAQGPTPQRREFLARLRGSVRKM